MSKKDKFETVEEQKDITAAKNLEEFKAKKRAAAQRWKENKVKEKNERVEKAAKFIEDLKAAGLYDKLTDEHKAFINSLANPTTNGNNNSLFKQLFGDNPAIGATITLRDAFEKTLKGKSNIDATVKHWAEKGTVVSFTKNAENMLDSVYTLEAIGSGSSN